MMIIKILIIKYDGSKLSRQFESFNLLKFRIVIIKFSDSYLDIFKKFSDKISNIHSEY